ncbi:MAG: hypothetical protein CMM00_01625 [Rhodopirellula sp.]|nr:hypothetical protein [Rhodopirellula sp.]
MRPNGVRKMSPNVAFAFFVFVVGTVGHLIDLGRVTEGFYDTAVTEAVEFEPREIVPRPTHFAYQRRCAEGLA